MNWRDFWNDDTPIYVSDRHKTLHYAAIARDIAAMIPDAGAVVLDHGCGEAISADRIANHCEHLYLCDAAPLVRARIAERFAGSASITVIGPDDVATLPDHGLDLVVANSLLQYLSPDELDELLGVWRTKLKDDGRLILADIIPHGSRATDDVEALLRFAWRGGFLGAAIAGLARTAFLRLPPPPGRDRPDPVWRRRRPRAPSRPRFCRQATRHEYRAQSGAHDVCGSPDLTGYRLSRPPSDDESSCSPSL